MDDQISNKEEKSASSSQQLKLDPGVVIYSLVQLKNVGLRNKLNLSITKSTMKMKNQQIFSSDEDGTQLHKMQESENTYTDEITNTSPIKAQDTITIPTKSNHDTLLYTMYQYSH